MIPKCVFLPPLFVRRLRCFPDARKPELLRKLEKEGLQKNKEYACEAKIPFGDESKKLK